MEKAKQLKMAMGMQEIGIDERLCFQILATIEILNDKKEGFTLMDGAGVMALTQSRYLPPTPEEEAHTEKQP